MSIAVGTRFGPYEIVSAVGAGGMGEVYRALDTKLGREVAIKVLADALATATDRVVRFEREARLLAALNHRHIATLFGIDEANGRHLLVMEFVDGETLAELLQRGALAVEEALAIAIQIAEALEAAHEKGIVHRDLKPANVKRSADGAVKVLDFGLAKAFADNASNGAGAGVALSMSPTLSMMPTQAGMILGTAAYMSPEQAKGFPADHRGDIFSFGVVLYEMLVGRQPFRGETAADVLASILAREPDFAALPANLSPRLIELLHRCLEKHPKRRWQAIGDVRVELEAIAASPRRSTDSRAAGEQARPWWRRALPAAVAAIAASVVTTLVLSRTTPQLPTSVTRFRIAMNGAEGFGLVTRQMVAISTDGSRIAYVSSSGLYIQSLSEMEPHLVSGTETATVEALSTPMFSPDGRFVAYFTGTGQAAVLKKVAVTGGAPATLGRVPGLPFGASWTGDDILWGSNSRGVLRMSANGGVAETLISPSPNEFYQSPQLLPDGESLLFTVAASSAPGSASAWDAARIVVESLKTHRRKVLVDGGTDARYLSTGHLAYAIGGIVYAAPFDARRLELRGGPAPAIEGVARAAASGSSLFAVSSNGTLAYFTGPATGAVGRWALAWSNPNGAVGQVPGMAGGLYETPRISPDGHVVAVTMTDQTGTNVWIANLTEAVLPRQLTFGRRNRLPVWSPNGSRVAFQSDREGDLAVFSQAADGTETARRMTKPEAGTAHEPTSWSPDGASLLVEIAKGSERTLWRLSVRDGRLQPLADVRSTNPINATFSPDGKWIAYGTNENATDAVFVEPFPQTGAKYRISRGDIGHHPAWARDGSQLFYIPGPGRFASMRVTTTPSFKVGAPTPAPRSFVFGNAQVNNRNHDIGPDGRALGIVPDGQTPIARALELNVVMNWTEELKQRISTR